MQPDCVNGLPRGQSELNTVCKQAVPHLIFALEIKKSNALI